MGVRLFLLSLLENAIEVSGGRLKADEVEKIIKLGKELLQLQVSQWVELKKL